MEPTPERLETPEHLIESPRRYTVLNPNKLGSEGEVIGMETIVARIKAKGFTSVSVTKAPALSLIDGRAIEDGFTIMVTGEERY